jgi:hypothetical protein
MKKRIDPHNHYTVARASLSVDDQLGDPAMSTHLALAALQSQTAGSTQCIEITPHPIPVTELVGDQQLNRTLVIAFNELRLCNCCWRGVCCAHIVSVARPEAVHVV